jgi:hypothetical protein
MRNGGGWCGGKCRSKPLESCVLVLFPRRMFRIPTGLSFQFLVLSSQPSNKIPASQMNPLLPPGALASASPGISQRTIQTGG